MNRVQAHELVDYIKEYSRGLAVVSVAEHRDAPRSQSYHVRASVSRQEEGGTRWWREYFYSREQFTESEWHDEHAPLRIGLLVADSMVASQRKYLDGRVADITKALRDLADRIDRDYASMDAHPNVTPERTVKDIQHAILWAVPNLHTEDLYPNAAMLTQHRARALAASNALIAAEYESRQH